MMVFNLLFGLLIGLGGITVSLSQTPIPSRPLGYTYTSPSSGESAKVVVEIFYDHLCSDSKATWNDFMKEVLGDIMSKQMEIKVIIHIFPLPYHHNAYFAQQVGVVVRSEDPEKFKEYIQLVFDNQDKFLSGAVNMTEPEVQKSMAHLASTSLGIDENKIMSGFSDEVVVEKARYAWKYAAYRGVTGTPFYMINGVIDPDAESFKKQEWEDYLSKLLNAPY